MGLRLVFPSEKYKHSYFTALREHRRESTYPEQIDDEIANFPSHLQSWRLASVGKQLAKGAVPHTNYWLIDGDEYIGTVQIRHRPQGRFPNIKSHIYYEIRPSKRGRGYGTEILRLALPKAKQLGLQELLITSKKTNAASRKIIEDNGGIFVDEVTIEGEQTPFLKYRISLQ